MSTRNIDPNNRNLNPNLDPNLDPSINTRPVTKDEVAYRDGYVQGKSAEQLAYERRRAADTLVYEENARLRTDNGISTGVILGFVLAAVAAVVGGVMYFYNNDTGSVAPEATTQPTTPEPANNETTIIERTIERTQEVVPAPSTIQPPRINVELSNPAPAPAPAAAPAPAPAPAPAATSNTPEAAPNQTQTPDTQP